LTRFRSRVSLTAEKMTVDRGYNFRTVIGQSFRDHPGGELS